MKKQLFTILLILFIILIPISVAGANGDKNIISNFENNTNKILNNFSNGYGIQWEISYGSNDWTGGRFEGPQPIGDCNNDGKNELLIGGRDPNLRIMSWDEVKQTYVQTTTLHPPFYPFVRSGCGGFAIGDLTGDGKNEIAATWFSAVYRFFLGRFWFIGLNPWIFNNGGGSADCFIGDCDNDGKNELIMSGGSLNVDGIVPEIVILKWNKWRLERVAYWDDPGVNGYVYMAGLGDVDYDGLNEIVCGSLNKVVVLKWDSQNQRFNSNIILKTTGWLNYPFACVCKDSDNDGKAEICVGFNSPHITIFKWNGAKFEKQYDKIWPGEEAIIEGLDVGDVNDDGIVEVCAGTNLVHILQWNGTTYVEQAVLPTYGVLAVVSIGDCDNDGKNEINVGSVFTDSGQEYMEWVFKYGWIYSK